MRFSNCEMINIMYSSVVRIQEAFPWYNSNLAKQKGLRRKQEHKLKFKKDTRSAANKVLLQEKWNKYNLLLTDTKKEHFKSKVESAISPKELFNIYGKQLKHKKASVLREYNCAKVLLEKLITYVNDKISQINS